MPKTKIVFFDIDSTLYDENKKVPESTREAIAALQQKGIITAIATGRAPFMFKDLRGQLGIRTYVSFNGSYVVHQNKGVYSRPLPAAALDALKKQSNRKGYPLVFLNERTMKLSGKKDERLVESIGSLKLNVPLPEKDEEFYKYHDIYQALLFLSENDDAGYLKDEPLSHFNYVRWHRYSVDVIPAGGSKALGIRRLLQIIGLGPEASCAFGDGMNDLEMLSYVGCGVAMGNAVAEAKRAADFVTKPVHQDGIYFGLKQIGLL